MMRRMMMLGLAGTVALSAATGLTLGAAETVTLAERGKSAAYRLDPVPGAMVTLANRNPAVKALWIDAFEIVRVDGGMP